MSRRCRVAVAGRDGGPGGDAGVGGGAVERGGTRSGRGGAPPSLQGHLGLPLHHAAPAARAVRGPRIPDRGGSGGPRAGRPSTGELEAAESSGAERTRAGASVDRGRERGAVAPTTTSGWTGGTTTVSSRRTSLIVDPPNGRMPPLTAEAQQRREERAAYRSEHPRRLLGRPGPERPVHVHDRPADGAERVQQQRAHLPDPRPRGDGHRDDPHAAGRAPRRAPAAGAAHPAVRGENRAATGTGTPLVVETMRFKPPDQASGARPPTPGCWSSASRASAPTASSTSSRWRDPATWARPWTARVELKKTDEPLYEYACHEGNYSMEGILAGARAEERAAAQEAR